MQIDHVYDSGWSDGERWCPNVPSIGLVRSCRSERLWEHGQGGQFSKYRPGQGLLWCMLLPFCLALPGGLLTCNQANRKSSRQIEDALWAASGRQCSNAQGPSFEPTSLVDFQRFQHSFAGHLELHYQSVLIRGPTGSGVLTCFEPDHQQQCSIGPIDQCQPDGQSTEHTRKTMPLVTMQDLISRPKSGPKVVISITSRRPA